MLKENVHRLRQSLERAKGRRDEIKSNISRTEGLIKSNQLDSEHHAKAGVTLTAVGLRMQEQIAIHIGDLVSLALSSVFEQPYELILNFDIGRGKPECKIALRDIEGNEISPLLAAGGGVSDVLSLALRLACWSIRNPKTRGIFVLDEPFTRLSSDLIPEAGHMVKSLTKELGIQVIMVTHEAGLIDVADKTFNISKPRQKSKLVTG